MALHVASTQGQSRAPGAETNCGIGPSHRSHAWMFRSPIAGLTEAETWGCGKRAQPLINPL